MHDECVEVIYVTEAIYVLFLYPPLVLHNNATQV